MLSGHLRVDLGRPLLGRSLAYVYVLCSKANNVVYVGQTNRRGGVWTRLGGHLGTDGTFRRRLVQNASVDVEDVEDLEVFAFALPAKPEYVSEDDTYRKGVEYRVQKSLRGVCGDWKPFFRLISNVTPTEATDFEEVSLLSAQILEELDKMYHH